MTTLLHNALLVDEQCRKGAVLIDAERIAEVYADGEALPAADTCVDLRGAILMPGVIDTHVHFREPGLTHKATIASESAAAIAGGVTSTIDMPNVCPATVSLAHWEKRMELGAERSLTNYAYYLGATNDNASEILRADTRRMPGVKLFMGSSTGNMLVDDRQAVEQVFRSCAAKGLPVVAHCEDMSVIEQNIRRGGWQHLGVAAHSVLRSAEACYRSSHPAATLARRTGARLHIAHLTTERELSLLGAGVTGELCAGYLLFSQDDYQRHGTLIKVNPAVKTAADRKALIEALRTMPVTIGSDHAPHLPSEKQGDAMTAASGMPIVQFLLPVVLDVAEANAIPLATAVAAMTSRPAELFGISKRGHLRPGYKADIAVVSRQTWTVSPSDVLSPCGWTALAGRELHHRVGQTYVNGQLAYDRGTLSDQRHAQALTFEHEA